MRTQAVIIKKIPIREFDELVVCYTNDAGKQVYQAKSILRPTSKQAGHLDIFNLVDFSIIAGNGQPIIASAYSLKSYPNFKSNLTALAVGYFLLECFDKIIFEGESDIKLWDFLTNQLENYDNLSQEESAKVNWLEVLNSGRRDLMTVLGYDPATPVELISGTSFKSLQFARKVIK